MRYFQDGDNNEVGVYRSVSPSDVNFTPLSTDFYSLSSLEKFRAVESICPFCTRGGVEGDEVVEDYGKRCEGIRLHAWGYWWEEERERGEYFTDVPEWAE